MAGTVVLDDVELREAQRDYLDFLDDEVREAQGREVPERGAWGGGAAEGGHAGRRSPPGRGGGPPGLPAPEPSARSFEFPRGGVSP